MNLLSLKTNSNMESNCFIQLCAKNSFGHRQETKFTSWLNEQIDAFLKSRVTDLSSVTGKDETNWRELIADSKSEGLNDLLDFLEDGLRDSFTSIGECIASVEYDHEGLAHSGCNCVYELCGVYLLEGSDYCEGPSENKHELLEYLDIDNPDHNVFWSEYAE